jgi:hypothetical protein
MKKPRQAAGQTGASSTPLTRNLFFVGDPVEHPVMGKGVVHAVLNRDDDVEVYFRISDTRHRLKTKNLPKISSTNDRKDRAANTEVRNTQINQKASAKDPSFLCYF